ncbi:hypothetical protein GKIL_0547 [Gloeobacter kilaueensis JS1]|uniref:Uncharacterized protein n=2 Tax=Gloeobacter TaxID=33071 RepID=U5QD53_GLOK1|nr:hypothetical protein GKIL_0547 [Gloeobacter kilaueensis JS1]
MIVPSFDICRQIPSDNPGVSWQMVAAILGAVVFFALPFRAFQTGKFSPPLKILGFFICLGLALQGWVYVAEPTNL